VECKDGLGPASTRRSTGELPPLLSRAPSFSADDSHHHTGSSTPSRSSDGAGAATISPSTTLATLSSPLQPLKPTTFARALRNLPVSSAASLVTRPRPSFPLRNTLVQLPPSTPHTLPPCHRQSTIGAPLPMPLLLSQPTLPPGPTSPTLTYFTTQPLRRSTLPPTLTRRTRCVMAKVGASARRCPRTSR